MRELNAAAAALCAMLVASLSAATPERDAPPSDAPRAEDPTSNPDGTTTPSGTIENGRTPRDDAGRSSADQTRERDKGRSRRRAGPRDAGRDDTGANPGQPAPSNEDVTPREGSSAPAGDPTRGLDSPPEGSSAPDLERGDRDYRP
jgi:hypothetical protein